jgi:hypothetical protein
MTMKLGTVSSLALEMRKEEKKKEIGKTAVQAGGGTMVKAILFRGIAVRDVHESLEISGVV